MPLRALEPESSASANSATAAYIILYKKTATPKKMAGVAGLEPTNDGVKVRCLTTWLHPNKKMVEGEGFEPSKAVPADLQSAPFGQLGNPSWYKWSRRWDSNPQPADYKSAALPIELRRHINGGADEIRTRDLLRDRQAC